ncbi:MAG: nicotinamide-nucleotide amidohydrolase family protein [Muribaculaceae bacterium]|nr:nicotinamide-nucleotide amidohydrolase family protein [Muribaculaceae bacterium]
MKLSIIIIGAEILLGQVNDTNSGAISRALSALGWETISIRTVDDSAQDIRRAVADALAESELVVCTGGLGPTKDDITKGVLMEIFGGSLIEDPEVKANVIRIFEQRNIPMNPLTLSQAMVPSSCSVIPNRYGTAPCMWFEKNGKVLVSLPGVPFETEGILADGVLTERIRTRFTPDIYFKRATLMACGISESGLAMHLEDFENNLPEGIHMAYLPTPGLLRLRLDGRGFNQEILHFQFDKAYNDLKVRLGDYLIFEGDAGAAEILLNALRRHGLKLATAESCTGGNIAHLVTLVPGCSDSYLGSIVSYANEVKQNVLGVDIRDIENFGVVSEPVVKTMVLGAMKATGADAAVATSGIAGPGGAVPGKPVGTVWIAAGYKDCDTDRIVLHAECFHFAGKRERVINHASTSALLMLARMLR